MQPFTGKSPSVPKALESKALPLEWLLDPAKARSLTDRILARLVQLEAHEPDVWKRDDYRQTFIALSLALKRPCAQRAISGERGLQAGPRNGQGHQLPICFIEASYLMYGLHPDKVYPSILARRAALLGQESPCGETSQSTAHAPVEASYKVSTLPPCASSGQTASTELTRAVGMPDELQANTGEALKGLSGPTLASPVKKSPQSVKEREAA